MTRQPTDQSLTPKQQGHFFFQNAILFSNVTHNICYVPV